MISFLEIYALEHANRANMNYLSHIKSPSPASMVDKWPFNNFVSHAHNMSPGKAHLSGQPGISGPKKIAFVIVNY